MTSTNNAGLITDEQWEKLAIKALDTSDPYWRAYSKSRRDQYTAEMVANLVSVYTEDYNNAKD